MTIDSKNIEFGYELISILPYAYDLHLRGSLEKTISGNDTGCLYYFSPNHEINPNQRSWYNTRNVDAPNINIHRHTLNMDNWTPPPLRKQYANKEFRFKKETIVICNRHNIEWGKHPINFFNLDTLESIFKMLQDEYQVIYINIHGKKELYDNAPPIGFGDYKLLKKYPKVINIHDLHKEHKKLSFNTLQLKIFANCKKYITMNGGHAILAAYFGGENIIMSKYGRPQAQEIKENVNSFYRWYHEFGGQRIKHVSNEVQLLNQIKTQWVDKDPVINILVRTSGRPNYFSNCIKSILVQTYKNINIIVSNDSNDQYLIKYPIRTINVRQENNVKPINNNTEYGKPFACNLYLNELQEKVGSGIIMYLDDDDILMNNDALELIARESKQNDLIFWRVKSKELIIPSDNNWGKRPVCLDISGIGLAFDSKYKDFAKWEPYKRGDFRVAKKLYDNIPKVGYIDKILTRTQNGQNLGNRKDGKIESNNWYITNDGKYWYGCDSIGAKKTLQGKMKKIDISQVPKNLIKN